MPVRDWTRVDDGVFRDFRLSWLVEIKRSVQRDLPLGYYALHHKSPRSIAVYNAGDRIVARIEVFLASKKSRSRTMHSMARQVEATLDRGIHLLLIDLHQPGPRDPAGIHGLILGKIGPEEYQMPQDLLFTVAAYLGGATVEAFVDHFTVRQPIPSSSLFLTRDHYLAVDLDSAYLAAWEEVPEKFQQILSAS